MNEAETTSQRLEWALREVDRLEAIVERRSGSPQQDQDGTRGSADFLRRILDTLSSIVLVVDPEGQLTHVNRAGRELLGVDVDLAAEPRQLHEFLIEEQHFGPESVEELLGESRELSFRNAQGDEIPMLLGGSRLDVREGDREQIVCIATDLRERKAREIEVRQSQRLETVGQLAAGIAHEINTPIQFIGDSITFLKEAYEDISQIFSDHAELRRIAARSGGAEDVLGAIREHEEEIDIAFLKEETPRAFARSIDGIRKVSRIVSAMKAFAHPGSSEMVPSDINEAITTTLTVASSEYRYVAEIETDLAELPPVTCHVGDINQVLLNLIVNAAHAIEAKVGRGTEKGSLAIVSRNEPDAVLIEISDSGAGIPPGARARIFDPFFTTKEVGKGTGQGLALAYKVIVDQHDGEIWFETEEGEGTTFFIRLPKNQTESHVAA